MNILTAFLLVAVSPALVTSDDSDDKGRVTYEATIDADIDSVWQAFSTEEGLQKWMAPVIKLDFRVGGTIKSNYNESGEIGDETTIENTILAFDPKRMIALKATGFPEGFPFKEVAEKTWSVFYFEELPSSKTKITIVGLGYTDDPLSKQMRSFFEEANKSVLEKLEDSLK